MEHFPVLLSESVTLLDIKQTGIYVDCTLGRAGHTLEILRHLGDDGKLVCFDQDIEAINRVKEKVQDKRIIFVHDNFKNLKFNLVMNGIENNVDGIFYDLGVSSPQFDEESRGFSYRFDADLDMRMDQTNNTLTAKQIINNFSEEELVELLYKYGDESCARRIVKKIVDVRAKKPINTTFELVDIIKSALPQKILKQKKHPAKKTFQALRIFVNDELNVINESLLQAMQIVKPGGIIAVITFHSLEEKIVKSLIREQTKVKIDKVLQGLPFMNEEKSDFILITKKPILPSDKELELNRRSHSAKLWAIMKREL